MNTNKRIDSLEVIRHFLDDVRCILTNPDFDYHQDFLIKLTKFKDDPLDPYTTQNTLIELNYDVHEVINTLLSLEVTNYLETIVDDKPNEVTPFYAFIKQINQKEVYIKIKIKSSLRRRVFCVSFHFAHFLAHNKLPYKR